MLYHGQKIRMHGGTVKHVEDIVPSDRVVKPDGSYDIVRRMVYKVTSFFIEFKLNGEIPILFTRDQRFLDKNGEKIRWKDLKTDMVLKGIDQNFYIKDLTKVHFVVPRIGYKPLLMRDSNSVCTKDGLITF